MWSGRTNLARKLIDQNTFLFFFRLNNGIYLKRGSIFKPYLNNIQHEVIENGLFIKWRADILRTYKKHYHINYENDVLPLTLQQLCGSFYLLVFGLLLSVFTFVVERSSCEKIRVRAENKRRTLDFQSRYKQKHN